MKLGTLLAGNAARNPDRVAVTCAGHSLTLGQLDSQANRIANAFLERGIGLGERIVVYLPNSVEVAEAMAGVLKAGGLVVPVSTRLTADEVAFILGHCQPRAIIYAAAHRDIVAAAAGKGAQILRLCVDQAETGELSFQAFAAAAADAPPPPLPAQPDDALIGYTSGTTGRPKGAVGTHMNLISIGGLIATQQIPVSADDVVFAAAPMAHRTGLSRLVNSFQFGCRTVMQPRFDAADAVQLIAREGVTVLGGVPTIIRMMMPEIEKHPEALATLRLISTTGETFPEALKERLYAAVPHVGLHTFLAQTEGGIIAALAPEEQKLKPGALGRAVPGVEVRLVDDKFNDVAQKETGEFVVRCGLPGQYLVMREYFRDPQATREAFVDGWFRTGDLGTMDADGYYYFADRAKDMIVSGGLNIYSKEVEVALLEHPAVDDVAVAGVPDAEFGEAVAAWVELRQGQTASAEELIDHCRQRIASYKKPKHVRFPGALPRNSTGKVLKFRLKEDFAGIGDP